MRMSLSDSFGNFLKLSVTGASHAPEMTFRLENLPAGFILDRAALAAFMERRAPGRDKFSTPRRETDEIEFRAGLDGDVTTGAPIVGAIANRDMRPGDYGAERTVPRPGHADFGQWIETGRIPTGGGKNSGRLTAPLCAAGGICRQFLAARGIAIEARLAEVGGVTGAKAMLGEIEKARKAGDSVGGRIRCRVENLPAGLGGALFAGLEGELSQALFAIPGVKGVTFGDAAACRVTGRASSFNDAFRISKGAVVTATNHAGGILGGRASGMPVEFDVWMKPTPTVFLPQDSVDLATMKPAKLTMKGRHDPCIVRRAVPVVEAVTAFALADAILADEAAHPRICLTLTGKTLAEDIAQYRSQRYFTDMVELRADLLEPSERAKAAAFPAMLWKASRPGPVVPIIFTFRRMRDGGAFAGSEKTRVAFFRSLLSRVSRPLSSLASRVSRSLSPLASPVSGSLSPLASRVSGSLSPLASPVSGSLSPLASRVSGLSPSSALYVDFEDDFAAPALEKLTRAKGVRIVRSHHDFSATYKGSDPLCVGRNPHACCRKMVSGPGEIAKLAFLPRSLKDVSRLFRPIADCRLQISKSCETGTLSSASCDLQSAATCNLQSAATCNLQSAICNLKFEICTIRPILLAMGAQGFASRVLAARLGAPWTYASVGGLGELGHVTPQELVRDYRFRSVTRAAALYGVTGWPLKATRSPELHNAMFAAADADALMIPFPAKTAREAIGFMNAMGLRGLAVTIPHKQAVMPLLDRVDAAARRVGAVNTVVREGTKLVGYNTDVAGFTEAICAFVRGAAGAPPPRDVRGLRAAVLGAGGASKAVVHALRRLGAKVVVFHRRPLESGFDLIVNATPVDPIPDYAFTGRELVYDLVYVPAQTPLLARARAAGCRCENGFSMLAAQAREQQRLFSRARENG